MSTGAACTGGGGGVGVATLRGRIGRIVADNEDGTSAIGYLLRLPGGDERALRFERDPDLPPDAPVAVTGRAAGDVFAVSDVVRETDADPAPRRGALVAAPPAAARKLAFVLVDTGGGVNLTVDTARQRLFDAGFFMVGQGSIRRYYQEDSYAVQDITGDVFGPLAYAPAATCDTRGVAATLRPQVDLLAGGSSDHYLWYFGSRQAGCAFAGAAAEGSPDAPQRDTWYNASSGCVVLVQEPGHNFGMQHSSSMACPGGQPFADAPDGTCTHNEYGDPFDPMGGGCRHMNGWQKAFEGWLGGCNGVKVAASGTFTLFPIESPCNGIQLLQVPMPRTRPFSHAGGSASTATVTDTLTSYYVELRAPVGFDQGLAPMVLIHVAGDLRSRTTNGLHTWLLDMTPTTASLRDAALAVGQTFSDPAGGLSITVAAASASQATIQIEIPEGTTPPLCLDGPPLSPPGPSTCSLPPDAGTNPNPDADADANADVDANANADAIAIAIADAGADAPVVPIPSAVQGCSCTLSPPSPVAPWFSCALGALPALALALRRRRRAVRDGFTCLCGRR
jgi:hypothetical protein